MTGDAAVTEGGSARSARQHMADPDGSFVVLGSFAEALRTPDAVVVCSGDLGSEVYLTAPVPLVRCDEPALETLASDLDAIAWMGGRDFEAGLSYEQHRSPGRVPPGGEVLPGGVWTAPSLDPEVAELAGQVVRGERRRLPGRLLRDQRAARLAALRQRRHEPEAIAFRAAQDLDWDYDVAEPVVAFPDTDG